MFSEKGKTTFVMMATAVWAIVIIGLVYFDDKYKSENDTKEEVSYSTHKVQDISFVKGSWLERDTVHVTTMDGTFVLNEGDTHFITTEGQSHLKLETRPGLSDGALYTGNLHVAQGDFPQISKQYADIFNRTMKTNDAPSD